MTHLNIQQGLNIEVVSTNLIKKLYEAALSVPEPLEGELDAAYMSGNLLVSKSYRALVEYLTNRFDDLHINVTGGYYIPFHDSAVNNVLKNTIGDGVGVTLEQLKAANPNNTVGPSNNTSIVDTREMCLMEGTISSNTFFADCTNLKIIGIPLNLTRIGEGIYKGVSPEKVVVKNLINFLNATKVSSYNRDQGWDLYLTNDGTNIEKIENLTIPDGVTFLNSILQSPFYTCTSIKNVIVPSGLTALGGFNNSSIESLTFEANSTLLNIRDNCFYQCSNFVFDVTNLPQTITTIGSNAFRSCSNITGVLDLPNLTSLGQYAFYAARITSITDLGSVTNIPGMCFNNCGSLTTVTLPSTCTGIRVGAFAYDTALTSIDLGGTTTIDNQAFIGDSNLTTVTGMSNLTVIGNNAFLNCPITGTLNLPNLTSLGNFAFSNCKFSTILSLGTISSLAEGMFGSMTNLTSVTLPSTLRTISWGTFNGSTSLTKLIIPEGVTSIINQQPNLMTGLIYIEVPSTVTDMEKCFHRFLEQNLNESVFMVIKAENPPALAFYNPTDTADNNMYNTNPLYGIYVPNVTTYQNASGPWQSLKILSKLKPISQLQTDNPTLWADYLSRINQS